MADIWHMVINESIRVGDESLEDKGDGDIMI